MVRETKHLEVETEEEFEEALSFAKSRNDGGRTVINLNGDETYYFDSNPIKRFINCGCRVTIEFNGLCVQPHGDGCVFRPKRHKQEEMK